MIYVALLRGINVGGKNKINMKELKVSFETIGMRKVTTYINSGNIIFENTKHSESDIVHLLENVILKDFSFEIKVLIRNINAIRQLIEKLPNHWLNDKTMKSDVLFLWDELDKKATLNELSLNAKVDTVIYVPGAILWSVSKEDISKSGLSRLVANKIYKKMTIRNVNTTRKIFTLMKELK